MAVTQGSGRESLREVGIALAYRHSLDRLNAIHYYFKKKIALVCHLHMAVPHSRGATYTYIYLEDEPTPIWGPRLDLGTPSHHTHKLLPFGQDPGVHILFCQSSFLGQ